MSKEMITLKGILTIEVYENNELVKTIQDKNTIVDDGFKILSSTFLGDSTKKISKLVIGDGGILDTNIKVVNATDHDLYNRIKSSSVTSFVDTINKKVSFTTFITFEAGENYIISEAGLFNQFDTMFNRKCFSEFAVNENFHLNIKWDIIFGLNDL